MVRSIWIVGCVILLTVGASAAARAAATTPLSLAIEGRLYAGDITLPWPVDPVLKLNLGARVQATVRSASSSGDAEPELVRYFNAAMVADAFVISDPTNGPTLLVWRGRWTNEQGFLLEAAFAGRRAGTVSQSPLVIALEGTVEIQGLSGRGRGVSVSSTWRGQLDASSGAMRIELNGTAQGELGPPPPQCREHTDAELAGELVPLMKRPDGSINVDHFSNNANDPYPHPFPYSTNPPTSGPHSRFWLAEGIHTTPQDDEALVHNLEHGNVIIAYHPSVAPAIVKRLQALVSLYSEAVLLVPRPANDVPIAAVSWGRIQKFMEYDEPGIQNFIDRNRGSGPECFF